MVDNWTGPSGLQITSVPGHDDLENDMVRRRHVTGEGHNGDTLTSAVSIAPTGKMLLCLLYFLSLMCCPQC